MNAISEVLATVSRRDLVAALKSVTAIVERRNTIPVLGHVKLTGSAEGLELRATDMDIEATATIAGPGFGGINCTTHAATMREVVQSIDGSDVEIGRIELGLRVRDGGFSARLLSLPPDDYPDMKLPEWSHSFEIAADVLRGMLGRTAHTISTEETRYYLNGVYLHVADGRMVAVATDGHRLAMVKAALPAGAEGMPGLIVPRNAVLAVLTMLGNRAEPVRVMVGGTTRPAPTKKDPDATATVHFVRFITRRLTLDIKVIDGVFPEYGRVIPDHPKAATIGRARLLSAIRRASALSNERSRPVQVSAGAGSVSVKSQSPETGEAVDTFKADVLAPFKVGFQARYLRAVAEQCGGDLVFHTHETDPSAPVAIHDAADPDILFVVMPMRV